MDAHPSVADGVLVGLSLWGTSIINLIVDCSDGRYFGSIRAPGPVYDHVVVSSYLVEPEANRSGMINAFISLSTGRPKKLAFFFRET